MEIPLTERVMNALVVQLIKSGVIDPDDVIEAADGLDEGGDTDAGHALRCLLLYASAAADDESPAVRARARFQSIEGGKSEG